MANPGRDSRPRSAEGAWTARAATGIMAPVTTRSAPSRPDPPARRRPADPAHADQKPRTDQQFLTDRLRAARAGDEQAFRDVYRAVHPGLVRYLRVLVA